MPMAPYKICRKPGCQNKTRDPSGFCEKCKPDIQKREKAIRKDYDKRRDQNVRSWLGSTRYKKLRKSFLIKNYKCSCGCGERATILDHKISHNGDYKLFWDESNWQAMYKPCHDKKTATEDGGFGNVKKNRLERFS